MPMKRIFFQLACPLVFASSIFGVDLKEKIEELQSNPYGFVFADLGLSQEDLSLFGEIVFEKERFYHQFGEIENTEEKISAFLSQIGNNEPNLTAKAAHIIAEITYDMMEASGKETGWIHLRCSLPTDRYDQPRWHMDGYYYILEGKDDVPLKFSATFAGTPTLFYFLPQELRKTAKLHERDRSFMKELCKPEGIVSASRGSGSIFIGGLGPGLAALHSEPPIHEKRIFFSFVPCTETQIGVLKKRVTDVYPKD
jgi:hypothetical protein